MKELLRRPLPWALTSAAALLVASSLPRTAPGPLFWSLVGIACLGAALAVWFGDHA